VSSAKSTIFAGAGSAALDLAYVACGPVRRLLGGGTQAVGYRRGHLLVTEAGGTISDFSGGAEHIWVGDVVAARRRPPVSPRVIREVFGGNVSTRAL